MPAGQSTHHLISLDKSSDVPIYRQLVAQIKCIIQTDQLSAGQPLPTIRQLASALVINPNTVARAYAELQGAGAIVKRRGSGCSVAPSVKRLDSGQKAALLADQVEQLVFAARELGVGTGELVQLIEMKSTVPSRPMRPVIPAPVGPKALPVKETVSDSPGIWQPDEEFID